MHKLVSSRAALEADRIAETSFGYPSWLLMEEAGIRLQDRLEAWVAEGTVPEGPTVYLAGSGNNGGDALVMARQGFLRGRTGITVVMVFPPSSEACRRQAALVRALGIPLYEGVAEAEDALAGASVWVDGVWGTGLAGSPRPERRAVLSRLEELRARLNKPCLAIDVPSGLWDGYRTGDPVLRARWTLTPGWLKDFCFHPEARNAVGKVLEVTLAFPKPAESSGELLERADLPGLLPRVASEDHKGKRGHVVLVGGAPGMTGALVLAARSAAASGAGLVSLGVDPGLTSVISPQVPAFQVREVDTLNHLIPRYDAAVVGPGWGHTQDRPEFLQMFWATDLPLVVDADGLAAWVSASPGPRTAPVVLTPHPGEFARLGVPGAPVVAAVELARNKNVTVVLKGAVTWILAPDGRRAVWDGANPALGTGGSGDCLAGVVGALLARGLGGFEAARAAVVLHGEAGRILAEHEGWFTADRLPEALARTAAACMAGLGRL